MNLTHCCIMTEDVIKLKDFYREVLQLEGETYGSDYAAFNAGSGILGIFDVKHHNRISNNSSMAKANKSILLEFNVSNIDQEYARIKNMNVEIIKEIRNEVWGNRSFYFLDPDGNMISFYSGS